MMIPFSIAPYPTLTEGKIAHLMGKGTTEDYSFCEAKKLNK